MQDKKLQRKAVIYLKYGRPGFKVECDIHRLDVSSQSDVRNLLALNLEATFV